MATNQCIKTVEMHTGGEVVRIIVSGYPPIEGSTILQQRQYCLEHLDSLRTMLMAEPRGHLDMYGALLVEKTHPQADMAVLFMHNEGYSTMCGHACISLGRYAVDYKLVDPVSPETRVNVQCPCGLVPLYVQYDAETGKTGSVRFESVPSYAFAVDQTVHVAGLGVVLYDIAYGGAFYAFVDIKQLNMNLESTPVQQLEQAATAIKRAVRSQVNLTHPEDADLSFLYGTILTDEKDGVMYNLCVFADHQVDRSPCGSGTCARTALQFHKGNWKLGEKHEFVNGKTGSTMTGTPVRVEKYGCYDNAVVVEVSGRGYYTGEASFKMEEGDPRATGFLIH